MADLMRIVSRDAFAQVLGEARARTQALDPSQSATLRRIADQLELLARTTARGRVPHEDDRARIDIGLIAAREFEETDPRYADQLQELDYTFKRYPLLPPGPPVRRRGVLQVWSGREAWHKLVLEPGVPRTVGTAKADFVVEADAAGSPHSRSSGTACAPRCRRSIRTGSPSTVSRPGTASWRIAGG
ncbi:immunity protein Tsi6 family protein [Nannocystis pusilla]|uniref:Immunity protein Tsi6 family protein n=1 Tax=Nannocystis pusilla TaxID=889268 RepID=A0A9X3EW55_9BACT|nr:immunity protein Tsi6 family protein [Nannocystis pusilla]MCY1010440.1 immunity protein Tsi6 family protein [Nannocystis pusilla]